MSKCGQKFLCGNVGTGGVIHRLALAGGEVLDNSQNSRRIYSYKHLPKIFATSLNKRYEPIQNLASENPQMMATAQNNIFLPFT
jgi:hypothetical protein